MEDFLFSNLTPDEIVILTAILGISIGKNLNDEELLVLAHIMLSAGVALLIIVSQHALLRHHQQPNIDQNLQLQIQQLRQEVQELSLLLQNP